MRVENLFHISDNCHSLKCVPECTKVKEAFMKKQ